MTVVLQASRSSACRSSRLKVLGWTSLRETKTQRVPAVCDHTERFFSSVRVQDESEVATQKTKQLKKPQNMGNITFRRSKE